jgi:hypothetical protein
MPIEREFKFLLREPDELFGKLDMGSAIGLVSGKADIQQGYLSRGGRIRRRAWEIYRGQRMQVPMVENIFTYKHDLTSQPGCLEIETELSQDDYDLAWSEADHKLMKYRFNVPDGHSAGVWEIDFFKDEQGIYLAMAEFEVPAHKGSPDRLHPLVEEYLVFAVPEDDGRFKNRKLCNRQLVEQLLKEIV